jgi:hypothetical protein
LAFIIDPGLFKLEGFNLTTLGSYYERRNRYQVNGYLWGCYTITEDKMQEAGWEGKSQRQFQFHLQNLIAILGADGALWDN